MTRKISIGVQIYPSFIENETRILKMSMSLINSKLYQQVYILGFHKQGLPRREELAPNVCILRLCKKPLKHKVTFIKFASFLKFYLCVFGVFFWLCRFNVVVHARTLSVAPIAVVGKLLFRYKLLYDVHELESESSALKGLRQKIFSKAEKILLKYFDGAIFVNISIKEYYYKKYGFSGVSIENYPHLLTERADNFLFSNLHLPQNSEKLTLVYSGVFESGRGIEELLKIFDAVEETYNFIFIGDGSLKSIFEEHPNFQNGIYTVPFLEQRLYQTLIREANVMISLITSDSLSYQLALPNKFLDGLNAGLVLLASNIPEQSRLINKYDNGVIIDDHDHTNLIDALNFISEDYIRLRANAQRCNDNFVWEANETVLIEYLTSVLNNRNKSKLQKTAY
jgi:glycosyltransferase involved in cell wall biosynthesis